MPSEQIIRQWRIIRKLEKSRLGLTVMEITTSLEANKRTIYRDLEGLQQAGFPLVSEKVDGKQRWRFMPGYTDNLPIPLAYHEILSLLICRDFMQAFEGTEFFEGFESTLQKIEDYLPPNVSIYLDKLKGIFSVGISPHKNYGECREIVTQVRKAVENKTSLEIAYQSLKSTKEVLRKIDPYSLRFRDGSLYVIGYCHLRCAMRIFVVDRMRMVRLTQEKFTIPSDFSVEDYLKDSFGVMRGGKLRQIRIRISDPSWARYISEKTWHESQEKIDLPSGGIELCFKVAGLEEIKRWVLSWGPQAEVLEPIELKTAVLESLYNSLKIYEPGLAQTLRTEIH